MSKKLSVLILMLITVCALWACGDKIEPGTRAVNPGPAVKVRIKTARIAAHPFVYTAVGTVKAATTSTLSSKLMGMVTEVNTDVGDLIKRGKVLVTIDDRRVNAQLQQARAALQGARRAMKAAVSARDAARAGKNLAEATYRRYRKLIHEDSATRQEFDEVTARYHKAMSFLKQAEAMMKAADSRIRQARAARAAARIRYKDAVIRAPYDAVVTARMVEVGDLASPGSPLLRLERSGAFEARLIVPEMYILQVRPGQKLQVHIPSMQPPSITGSVKTVFPTADPETRTFLVKVTLPKNGRFKSGMFARADIPVGESGLLTLPRSAVVTHGQLTGFYRVDEQRIAHFRLIRTGRILGDIIEVISGLNEGDRYVTGPRPNLADGVRVEIGS